MCRLQNIAAYSDNLYIKCDKQMDRQMPDKVITMCRNALQATQKNSPPFPFYFFLLLFIIYFENYYLILKLFIMPLHSV